MGALLQFAFNFTSVTCYKADCSLPFAISKQYDDHLLKTHNTFYCPRGHAQHYTGKTEDQLEIDRLKARLSSEQLEAQRKLEAERKQKVWAEERAKEAQAQRDRAKRGKAAITGLYLKTKHRVGHGVCPCCNRTFKQLAAHMKQKHPKYKNKKVDAK